MLNVLTLKLSDIRDNKAETETGKSEMCSLSIYQVSVNM